MSGRGASRCLQNFGSGDYPIHYVAMLPLDPPQTPLHHRLEQRQCDFQVAGNLVPPLQRNRGLRGFLITRLVEAVPRRRQRNCSTSRPTLPIRQSSSISHSQLATGIRKAIQRARAFASYMSSGSSVSRYIQLARPTVTHM